MVKIIFLIIILTSLFSLGGYFILNQQLFKLTPTPILDSINPPANVPTLKLTAIPTPAVEITQPSTSKLLPNKHISQTFNNCGPATLSMVLNFWGLNVSQQELGQELRPYQNSSGDNDDKSVTLEELANKAKEYDFVSYHRPNGDINLVKTLLANDIPIITRTWLHQNEDIGHYRIIKGFDENTGQLIQDDSYEGANLRFTYDNFLNLWQPFSYEFLIIVPQEKDNLVKAILKDHIDVKVAWQKSLLRSQEEGKLNPSNPYPEFNISMSQYHLGNYQASVQSFEKVENLVPKRMLWYQIEPILAYQKLENYPRVFELTDKILNNYNRGFSELYQIRGESYLSQGKVDLATKEFELALFYNKNYTKARESLDNLE